MTQCEKVAKDRAKLFFEILKELKKDRMEREAKKAKERYEKITHIQVL